MCKKILTAGLAVLMVLFASCSADMFSKVDDVSVLSVIPDDDFSQTGVLTLSLIPLDKDGDVIVSNSISLKADYVQDGDIVELDVSKPDVKKPEKNALPWAFAIDIDASGSMSSSDPKKIRIESSKLFVDSILTSSPSSKIAVATFGDGTSNSFLRQNFYRISRPIKICWTTQSTLSLLPAVPRCGILHMNLLFT